MADLVLRPGPDGVRLVRDRAYERAFFLRTGRTDQSYVDLDDPLRLEFDYVQRIADIIDAVSEPPARLRALHIGGAALTLPRYLAATRRGSSQLVLEPDAELTAFVRRELPLPARSGIRVRPVDGLTGVAALPDAAYEVAILDAFDGPRTPAELTTVEYLADLHRVLGHGMLIANVTDRGPLAYARRVLAGLAACFASVVICAEPATFKGRRFGNVVLAASDRPLPYAAIAGRAGSGAFPYRVLHGPRLQQLLGGAQPFTGAGESSPEPPRGLFAL